MSAAASSPPRYLRWLILGTAAALLVFVGLLPDVREFLVRGYHALTASDPAVTRAFVDTLGWAGPLALIAGFVLQAVIPVLPSLVMTAVTARAYGPIEGFFIVYVGTLLGAAAGYWLGRTVGDSLVRLLAGEKARRTAYDFAQKHGVQGVLMVRLMPILSADAMNLVAGTVQIPFRAFMVANAAGALPVTALVVWLSDSAQRMAWGLGLLSLAVGVFALWRWWSARRRVAVAGAETAAAEPAPPAHPSEPPAGR
ncbi:TVP38/TMEM64 family protein [Deinococcus sp. Leaf326]|uniref:TVP38/TMEM64 family protein n=1 Tax=Deinococcus sp. Leaf326 TaxID=1736338 RepID=UPI0006F39C00|nr:VTT domain-containing protein [Deinococcus sp. Leaf326]KQR27871.1 hypothetical protein ASF71_04540 [Deinococcus sp. Leaf326]